MFNLTFYIIVKFSFILLYLFQNLIEKLITRFKNNVNHYKDIGCAWDVFKTLREKTIFFCKSESQKRKSEIQVLDQKLKSLNVKEDDLCGDLESNVLDPKHNEIAKTNLENVYFVKARGVQIRSYSSMGRTR